MRIYALFFGNVEYLIFIAGSLSILVNYGKIYESDLSEHDLLYNRCSINCL